MSLFLSKIAFHSFKNSTCHFEEDQIILFNTSETAEIENDTNLPVMSTEDSAFNIDFCVKGDKFSGSDGQKRTFERCGNSWRRMSRIIHYCRVDGYCSAIREGFFRIFWWYTYVMKMNFQKLLAALSSLPYATNVGNFCSRVWNGIRIGTKIEQTSVLTFLKE